MDNKEKNKVLVRQYRDGDTCAFDELIESNLGLVRSAAKRFVDRGTEYDDLVQIGTVGLIKAAKAFDAERGFEFSTYAFTMIVGEIRRFLRDDGLIKVSRNTKKLCAQLLREKEKYISEFGTEPHISFLADKCNITPEEAVFCIGAMNPVISMNSHDKDEDSDFCLEDRLGIDSIGEYVEHFALKQAISKLSEEERVLIQLRYEASLTQSEVAKRLNSTQVKISRTEKKILEKLRRLLT